MDLLPALGAHFQRRRWLVGAGLPDEGAGLLVVLLCEAVDGILEIDNRVEEAVLQSPPGWRGLDGAQQADEFLMARALHITTDDRIAEHIECGDLRVHPDAPYACRNVALHSGQGRPELNAFVPIIHQVYAERGH